MLGQYVRGRVYVFIDVENTFYAQDTLRWRIAYAKLMRYLRRECGEKVRCFAYSGVDEYNTRQKKFLDLLDIHGYIVRTKIVKKIRKDDGSYKWKSNLDMELGVEMLELREQYDTAVLVSGDSDFAIIMDKLKESHKQIVVLSTRGRVARELLKRAKFIDLGKLRSEISQ